ncbi:Bug family tripartite tricarboxylate transporter substrate binding protein [Caenimonas aquaedulcis]|uniref:Tripartite tricarboxylate transporter substrate binding protein n=1 Tax=Caenimonas aquaedulcis TaxID=2793270 RepID=A0A931H8P3_9BURK|nr:tripartite tricarboxylate transporter substrate binding protein [Caenimonas aquaedulcis]MBG9390442.1 tripartite tricarboxylate transporter substrate binding protein [Caenimonas aquaedulcis]
MSFHMSRRGVLGGLVATGLSGLPGFGRAQASDYPRRPIKIVVPWAAGGGSDTVVRTIAPVLSQRLGQPVIVDNRAGATGTLGSAVVANSPADGYTLLFGSADSQSIAPQVMRKAPYPNSAFVSIGPVGITPLAVMVHGSNPAKTFAQFTQMARDAKPPLFYGSWGIGSSGHIAMEALKDVIKVDMKHVPYLSTAPLMQAQLSREIDCSIIPLLVAEQYAKAGTVRILAINSPERLPGHPDVPLLKDLGIAGLETGLWTGLLAPAGTPPAVIEKLNAALDASIAEPQVAEAMKKMSLVVQHMPSAKYQEFTQAEYDRWGRYIKKARIEID